MIPCPVADVTDEEAEKILATYDPLIGMAGTDPEKLKKNVLGEISTESEALAARIDSMAADFRRSARGRTGRRHPGWVSCAGVPRDACGE